MKAPTTATPAKRVRAIRLADNRYQVVEETFASPPTSVRVLRESCSNIEARYEVRTWLQDAAGPRMLGDSELK